MLLYCIGIQTNAPCTDIETKTITQICFTIIIHYRLSEGALKGHQL